MKPQVLTGSKQEIADTLLRTTGEVREAIIFVDEPSASSSQVPEDVFAEMESFLANAGDANYSRDALYGPADGE
jgi:hypothetical protein